MLTSGVEGELVGPVEGLVLGDLDGCFCYRAQRRQDVSKFACSSMNNRGNSNDTKSSQNYVLHEKATGKANPLAVDMMKRGTKCSCKHERS